MSEPDNKKNSQKKFNNIFIANSIYPEVHSIFKLNKTLEEIKTDCYIVLDTSVLLLPYNAGKESLSQIKKTYKKLIAESRLIIPAQAAREFVKNRANKLIDLYQNISQKKNKKVKEGTYPLLEALDEYQEILELENLIESKLQEYRNRIDKLLKHIESWTWNDPVSLIYAELFDENVIIDTEINEEEIKKDLERRQEYKIPPGYADASKPDSGVGDLLIWYSLLEVAKKYKKSVIFVSGEKKSDWWHKRGSDALYPRYELVDEFRRYSEGQSFHIIELSHLLQLYGASETAIKEIEQEEKNLSISHFNEPRSLPSWLQNSDTDRKIPTVGFIRNFLDDQSIQTLKNFLQDNINFAEFNQNIIAQISVTSDFKNAFNLSFFNTNLRPDWANKRFQLIEHKKWLNLADDLGLANSLIAMLRDDIMQKTINKSEKNIMKKISETVDFLEITIKSIHKSLSFILMKLNKIESEETLEE